MMRKMDTYLHVTPNHAAILLLLDKTNLNGLTLLLFGRDDKVGVGTSVPIVEAKEVWNGILWCLTTTWYKSFNH